MLAYRAVEADDRQRLAELLDRLPRLAVRAERTATTCSGWPATRISIVWLLLERGADPNRGNDYGWTKLHQAGYSNDPELATLMLARRRAHRPLRARRRRHTAGRGAVLGPPRGRRRCSDSSPATCASPPGSAPRADPRASSARRRPARTEASTARTAAFPSGGPPTTRRRCSTRRSSGRPRADRVEALRLLVPGSGPRGRRPVPRHGPRLGGRERPRRRDPPPRRARRRPESARHLRRARPRRGRPRSTSPRSRDRERRRDLLELGADPTLPDNAARRFDRPAGRSSPGTPEPPAAALNRAGFAGAERRVSPCAGDYPPGLRAGTYPGKGFVRGQRRVPGVCPALAQAADAPAGAGGDLACAAAK